jgi:50S ribosomal protein L16 3-hydroxylase
VQLAGRKRWELAANTALPYPLSPHVAGGPVHALNQHAAAALADREMPADTITHVLEPGAALFVPRGMWHRTHALDDSLSLSFGLRAPSRAEQLLEALGDELGRDPAWRAPAFDPARLPRATIDALRAAVARLREP